MLRLKATLARKVIFTLLASLVVVIYPTQNASASLVNITGTVTLPDGTPVDHLSLYYMPTGLDTGTAVTTDVNTGAFSFQASPGSGLLWMATGGYGSHCPTLTLGNENISRAPSSILPACFRSFAQVTVRNDSTVSFGFGFVQPTGVHLILPDSVAIHFQVRDAATQAPIPFARLANAITSEVVTMTGNRPNGSTTWPNGSNILNAPTWIPFGGLNYSETGSVTTDANGELTIRGFKGDFFDVGAYDHVGLNFIAIDPNNPNRTFSVTISSLSDDISHFMDLPEVETIAGTLQTSSNVAIGNALMEYVPTGSSGSSERVFQAASNGAFTFQASPGTGVLNIFGRSAGEALTKVGAAQPTLNVPFHSSLSFPITITSDGKVSITGGNQTPIDASAWTLTLPDVITASIQVQNASDQSPVSGAKVQANNTWGYTDVTVLGTTQHLIWQLPNTYLTADSQGEATLTAWDGAIRGYPNSTNFSGTFPIVFTAADPSHVTRSESATVTSLSSTPISIAIGDLHRFSGSITMESGTAVGNVAIGYAPGAGLNSISYSLNGSGTFNAYQFSQSTITNSQGEFTLSGSEGEGGLFIISGSNSLIACRPSQVIANALTLSDLATVDVPACTTLVKRIRINPDGSVTELSNASTYASNAVNLTFPSTAYLTIRVVDEITGETITGVPVEAQVYELGARDNYNNLNQNLISRPWGSTTPVTDENGEIRIPMPQGRWDCSPQFVAYDPTNSARNNSYMTDHLDGDATIVLALPDPPLPPETATATLDSGNTGSATIDWTLPTNDGGLPITEYVVTAEQDTSVPSLRVAAPVKFTIRTALGRAAAVVQSVQTITHRLSVSSLNHLSDTISGLVSGVTYKFSIKAVNSLGQSQPKLATKRTTSSSNNGGGGGGFPMMAPPLSTDTSLKTFTVNGTTAGTGSTFELPVGTTSVTVVATATDSGATVAIAGATGLVAGKNTLTVTVTAADGSKKSYTVSINVAEPVAVVAPTPVVAPVPVVVVAPPTESVAPAVPVIAPAPAPKSSVSLAVAKATVAKPATTAAKAPAVNAVAGQKINVTVNALPKSTTFAATVLINGKPVKLGTIKSSAKGALVIPSFKQTKAGTYTIQLTNSKGAKYYIKVVVKAAKK